MKKKKVYMKLIEILEYIQHKVNKLKDNIYLKTYINSEKTVYSDLMPKDEVDKVKTYHRALDWAIKENSRIRNIALSGPYGAGKSTIITSYIKSSNISEEKFLLISLATFDENNNKVEKEKLAKQQHIEKSILEQMIYRVDGRKTPYSRFKKINKVSRRTIWKNLMTTLMFFISGWLLYNNNIILKLQGILVSGETILRLFNDNWLVFVVGTIFGITSIIILYYLFNSIFRDVKIAKIKYAETEIEIAADNNESIYNKHLDELLYFFEETQYEIVIFEDIDRFENPSIFTNLREINTFLYNYEKISRRIIFLYAIKDDMFSDKERTKFFDFIIPIIPFVDAFNSRQVVLDKFKEIKSKEVNVKVPSKTLIKDITIFLDDMRMLNNIINEYIIYYKQIDSDKVDENKIDADKLFSIIVYKNLLPKDFSELQYNRGLVKNIFDKKRDIIKQKIDSLEKEILNITKLIELTDSVIVNSTEDLYLIFCKRWQSKGISSFYIDDNYYNQVYIANNNILERKKDFVGKDIIKVTMNNHQASFSYNDIFTAFGTYDNFFDMIEAIKLKNKEKMQTEKEKLNDYINRKNELKLIKLRNLIKEYDCDKIFDEIKDEKLLIFLIREGHIDEAYRHYMSYFYPGAITQEDMLFLRSVKNYNELGYEYKLENVDEIIKDISADELKSKSVLNNHLIEYLLNNLNSEEMRLDMIFQGLVKKIDVRIDFINQFCEKSEFKEIFITELCKRYSDFWEFIVNKSKLSDERINTYFTWIINACDTSIIIAMNKDKSIKEFIENTQNILQMEYTINAKDKLKTIFKELNIKFQLLNKPKIKCSEDDKEKLENDLIIYILENNMFYMNQDMIRYFYGYFVDFDVEKMNGFECKNYSTIKILQNKSLNDYIENNLNEYFTNVFLTLPQNINEDVSMIIKILNNENVNNDIKIKIINRCKFIIKKLSSIYSGLWDSIIESSKWEITWINIAYYYNHFSKLSNKIIRDVNHRDVYQELSCIMIDEAVSTEEIPQESLMMLYKYLYENESLSDKCFIEIQNAIPESYFYLDDTRVSLKRMKLILDNYNIEFNKENYLYLKNNYDELYYDWSIMDFDEFLNFAKEISLEIKDINKYLNDSRISNENKVLLINSYREHILENFQNKKLIESIFKIVEQTEVDKLENDIFEALIYLEDYYEERVLLLANKVEYLTKTDIRKYLEYLGEPLNFLTEEKYENNEVIMINKEKYIKYLLIKLFKCKFIQSFTETDKSFKIKFQQQEVILEE